MDDTIYALASGAGRAGIAVFRLSGQDSGAILERLAGRPLPEPRRAVRVRLSWQGVDIDDGLAIWFPSPASFTGENVVEFHLHGGRAVAQALTEALGDLGARPAEPGEFSRRAFLSGKLDLTQAEAIADLIDAQTEAQRRQALRQMDGALTALYDGWRSRLLSAQAHVEAEIDFSDENLDGDPLARSRRELEELQAEMQGHLSDGGRGERLREGFWIVLVGPVNAGKSSLLNRLAGRAAAIVSSEPGTTRDVVEVTLDIGGFPVVLADTAGLRETGQTIEAEGIARARAKARTADLRLVVLDGTKLDDQESKESLELLGEGRTLAVINKADLAKGDLPSSLGGVETVRISALTGAGMDELHNRLTCLMSSQDLPGHGAVLTRARHRQAVTAANEAITRALNATLPELAAEDVRVASGALGRITGRIDVEDVLDSIFREFCIGK